MMAATFNSQQISERLRVRMTRQRELLAQAMKPREAVDKLEGYRERRIDCSDVERLWMAELEDLIL